MLPSSRILKRKIRLVQSEVKMLQSYHDQCLELLIEYEVEFNSDISYFKKAVALKDGAPECESPEEIAGDTVPVDPGLYKKTDDGWEKIKDDPLPEASDSNEDKDLAPEWAKKLYKKIALATHPDKVGGHTMEQELIRKFLKAGKSYQAGEYDELVAMAIELNIDIELGDEAMYASLSKQKDSLRSKISEVESNLAWIWCENCGNIGLKAKILLAHLDYPVNITELEDMITEKERDDANRGNRGADG